MQENDFEKQVQQKMDGLKLNPSASVWGNIESKIQKERKRRRAVIFLPLLIICFMSLGYFLWNASFYTKQKYRESAKNIFTIKRDSGKITSKVNTEKNITIGRRIPNISTSERKLISQNISLQKINYRIHKKPVLLSVSKSKVNIKVQQANASDIAENEAQPEVYKENLISEKTILNKEIESNNKSISDSSVKKSNDDSIKIQKENQLTTEKKVSASNKKNKKKNSLNWGVTLSGGISDLITDNTLNPQSYSQDYTSIPASPSMGNFTPKSPSKTLLSGALTVGFFIEKKLFKSVSFKSGLNYELLSTSILKSNNSLLLLQGSSKNYYNNHYHFIQVPVELEVLLFNLKKTSLYWTTGLSIFRYLGSNALQFDYVTGLYYKGDLFFNKNQVSLSTGLSLSLFSKQKNPIQVGPFFEYGISKVSNKGLYTNAHFIYTGLKAQVFLNKK